MSAIGQYMVPSSARITSGEPALAQEMAHDLLMGLLSPLVMAHAESRTQPFTVTVGASAAFRKAPADKKNKKDCLCNRAHGFHFVWLLGRFKRRYLDFGLRFAARHAESDLCGADVFEAVKDADG